MDKRKALEAGSVLRVYEEKGERKSWVEFGILGEVGRGGSCIVYDASYVDSVGSGHRVRLKECWPYGVTMERDGEGRLWAAPERGERFLEAREKFVRSYKNQAAIRGEMGLVNITVGALELYRGGDTVYSVMDYSEGMDYGKVRSESLWETLQRVKAAARAVERYHGAGYLHLDIKPENVWLIPETMEFVQLSDVDSVVREEELAGLGNEGISFTEGFGAPELMAGDMGRIGRTADVYGLGALLFYRLMGRCPGRQDREYGADYDFSSLEGDNPFCRPSFFRELRAFFNGTLAGAAGLRFQTVGEVLEGLGRLMVLSDREAVWVRSNFSYHQNCFVGRQRELGEIRKRLSQKHVLFLHGLGGIGKTELAMRYAYENGNQYETVLMLRYQESLEESLCREDIVIENFTKDQGEEEYGKRKLAALKSCVGEKDLVILDNFDQEDDQLLEDFLELPCHILITSRCDFSDWNYPQMEVGTLETMEELKELFGASNDISYEGEEEEAVEDLIRLVECHTMLTELIAKNLRISGNAPSRLRDRLMEAAGTGGITPDPVRHRKDRVRLQAQVQRHLRVLFDISELGEAQLRILENLSLFGGVRIDRHRFLEWSGLKMEKELDSLIQRGWIEGGREGNKVSLHQIILDLIYEDRKPGGENCGPLVRSVTAYMEEKPENQTRRRIRNRMCSIFGKRLQGKSWEMMDYYLAFCENVRVERPWLEVCLEEYGREEEGHENELARVYCLLGKEEIRKLVSVEGVLGEELQLDVAAQAADYFQKGIWYKKRGGGKGEYGEFVYSIGKFCGDRMENALIEERTAVRVYEFSVKCMEDGAKACEEETGGAWDEKTVETLRKMYEGLMDFYDPEAVCLVRPEYFGDVERRLYYGAKREEICPAVTVDKDGKVRYRIDRYPFSWADAGERAELAGDLEAAVRYYKLAAERGETEMAVCPDKVGYLYEEMGEIEKALAFFLERYGDGMEEERGDRALCIGRLYRKMGQWEKTAEYVRESMEYFGRKAGEDGENGYWKGRVVEGYGEMCRIPGEIGETAWREGMEFYETERERVRKEREVLEFQMGAVRRILDRGVLKGEILGHQWGSWRQGIAAEGEWEETQGEEKQSENGGEWRRAAWMLRDAGENCLEHFVPEEQMREVLEMIEKVWEKAGDALGKAGLLMAGAGLAHKMDSENVGREKEFYEKGLGALAESGLGDCVQAMVIRRELAKLCSDMGLEREAAEYGRGCDYEKIGEEKAREIGGKRGIGEGERWGELMEVWKEGGDGCLEAVRRWGGDKWEMGRRVENDNEVERDEKAGNGERGESDEKVGSSERGESGKSVGSSELEGVEVRNGEWGKWDEDLYGFERLRQAARCYERAAEAWHEMGIGEKGESLWMFGGVMENWMAVYGEMGEVEKIRESMWRWHGDVMGVYGKAGRAEEKGNDGERNHGWIGAELRRLAGGFGKWGDGEGEILCLLEMGIVGLGIGYDWGTGSVEGAAEKFFGEVRKGVGVEKVDLVMEVCERVGRLCEEMGRCEVGEECKGIVELCGGKVVGFK